MFAYGHTKRCISLSISVSVSVRNRMSIGFVLKPKVALSLMRACQEIFIYFFFTEIIYASKTQRQIMQQ